MSGILPAHLRDLIIRPTLVDMGHYSPAAEALLLGTVAHESRGGRYLAQLGGPARGIYQMEPATHDDLWRHFLPSRRPLKALLLTWAHDPAPYPSPDQMVYDLRYATAMARVHYLRVPAPLPAADDLIGQAAYWKRYYNTPAGKGTVEQYTQSWHAYMGAPK